MDRGERLEREGRNAEVEALYRKILAANPENYTVLVKLGTLLQGAGRLEEAQTQFIAARDLNPLFVHAHYNLASIALAEGDLNAAEQGFLRAVALDPDHLDARLQLARLAINAKRFNDARTHLGRVESLDPGEPNLLFLRGLLEAESGNLSGAAVWFEKTLVRKPDYADAALNLAAARFALGETDPAIRAYRRAIELDPGRPEPYLQLGAVLLNAKDDPAGAARAFRTFLERFPGHPEAGNVRELVAELTRAGY
jgi:tetratricopeptide (TPR) repeat protein